MGLATEHIWHALRKSVREDLPGFQFAPLLLLGPPGIGKSHWARRLGFVAQIAFAKDSLSEFSVLACGHEQLDTDDIQDPKLESV